MIYLIEPYNAYQKPPKKKHWTEIADEEALLVQMQLEEAARQKVVQDAQRQDAIRQIMTERDAAANSNLNNQNIALPQYQPQPAAQQVQNGQYAAPAGGGGWVIPTAAEQTEIGDFIANPLSGVGPLSVSFTNLTPSPENDTFLWDFGSGSITSTDINPSPFVYLQTGSYVVTLHATSSTGNMTAKSQVITVADPTIFAWISSPLLTTGVGPMSRSFTISNSGTAPNSTVEGWFDFGDGTAQLPYTASGMNSMTFVHIYESGSVGTASLALTESSYGHNSVARVYFSASIPFMSPSFTLDVQSGIAPMTVNFDNTSTYALASPFLYRWVYGDGTTSTYFEPPHTYNTGTFPVRLDMSESYYSMRASYLLDGGITASAPTLAVSYFRVSGSNTTVSGTAPIITIVSASHTYNGQGTVDGWVDYDGVGSGQLYSVMVPGGTTHVYSNTGSYTASLALTESSYNIRATASVVYISASVPVLIAGFTLNSASAGAGPDYEPMTASVTSSITYNGLGTLQSTLSFISESVVIESFYNFTNATTYITSAGAFTASMYVTESSFNLTSSYSIPFVVQT